MSASFTRVARPAWVILALALGATVLACVLLRNVQTRADAVQLQQLTTRLVSDLQTRLALHERLLRSSAASLLASRDVSPQSWNRYVAQLALEGTDAEIQQIGYAQRTAAAQGSAPEQALHADGTLQLHDYAQPAASTHMPVLYVNQSSDATIYAGFDLAAVPTLVSAIARATDSGQATLSVPFQYGLERATQPARLLLLLPIFADGVLPPSIAQRRSALVGLVFATLRFDHACEVVSADAAIEARWSVAGSVGSGIPLCSSQPGSHYAPLSAWRAHPVTLYGQQLTLQIRALGPPTSTTFVLPGTLTSAVAIGGILVSVWLFWLARAKSIAGAQQGASRRRSARTLRQLETQVSALIELNERAVLMVDRAQRIRMFNPAAERLFDTCASAAIGMELSCFLPRGLKHAERTGTVTLTSAKLTVHRLRNSTALPARRANGQGFGYRAEVFKTGRWGRTFYVVLLRQDFASLPYPAHASKATADSTGRSQHTCPPRSLAAAPDDVAHATPSRFGHFEISVGDDPRAARIEWSSGMIALLGCRPDIGAVLVTRFIETRLHIDDRESVQRQMDRAFSNGAPADFCYRMHLPDGTLRHVRQWMTLARTHADVRLFVGVIVDDAPGSAVTPTDELETILAASMIEHRASPRSASAERAVLQSRSHATALRELVDCYDLSREEQQKRLAQEMHDDFGQLLAAMKIDLGALQKQVAEAGPVDRTLLRKLIGMNDLVDTMVASVRRIMADLPPKLIDEHGLFKAVELLVDSFGKRHRIACALQLCVADDTLSEAIATPLYRVVQEALNNIAKHASASQVTIEIERSQGQLLLVIGDDGIGIDPGATTQPGSYGLVGMRQRVAAMGGTMHVTRNASSTGSAGTMIRILVPLAPTPASV